MKGSDQTQIWLAAITLAGEIETRKSVVVFPNHEICSWELKKLRMHVYAAPPSTARTASRVVMNTKETACWVRANIAGLNRLLSLPGSAPGQGLNDHVRVRPS